MCLIKSFWYFTVFRTLSTFHLKTLGVRLSFFSVQYTLYAETLSVVYSFSSVPSRLVQCASCRIFWSSFIVFHTFSTLHLETLGIRLSFFIHSVHFIQKLWPFAYRFFCVKYASCRNFVSRLSCFVCSYRIFWYSFLISHTLHEESLSSRFSFLICSIRSELFEIRLSFFVQRASCKILWHSFLVSCLFSITKM